MLLTAFYRLVDIYSWLIVAAAVLSWCSTAGGVVEDIRGALLTLTEPYVGLFRRFVPPLGGVDFSPVLAILVLEVILRLMQRILI